ncbi:class I SAM-dependent methyltransferase [Novosphingobium piscinae]|uniref:Class I SAM-dependent methyltransferase n=1 Tax=Novosphingobium piscinae TaxID=1507448 RepID=A0A7X1FZ14_9SPHN|nr:class I SAM-dependent methyltransferase [Novosphingobium piscinae]MBC2669605.1 class I SAM-dependent methyltransferase [Novosphingobium piscinae]
MRAWPVLALALAACRPGAAADEAGRAPAARGFPRPDRPVSTIGATQFSSEDLRDRMGEARTVMDLARIAEGMTVADLGAGEGYYTIRLAERVGRSGRVLAEDIDKGAVERLGLRVERQRLDQVSIRLGTPEDPRLPAGSFDRVFMVHMYHEVAEPYAFLWNLRPALRKGGSVIVVDADRPTGRHGTPPGLLFCEFAAVGFRLVEFARRPTMVGYYARFETDGPRPAPASIKPCKLGADGAAVGP